MKKSVIPIIFLCMLGLSVSGNIVMPRVYISEFGMESPTEWWIELGFEDYFGDTTILKSEFDSLYLETSSGKYFINYYNLIPAEQGNMFDYLTLITNDNLDGELAIDGTDDFIKLFYYGNDPYYYEYLAYGKAPASSFRHFEKSYSIALTPEYSYSLDKTPSPGSLNQTEGMTGVVRGYFYDREGYPLAFSNIWPIGGPMTDEDGYFETSLYACSYYIDTIQYWGSGTNTYIYATDTLDVYPDSTCTRDIVLLSHLVSSAIMYREQTFPVPKLEIFPNPFNDLVVFSIILPLNNNFESIELVIHNSLGQLVYNTMLDDDRTNLILEPAVVANWKPGQYFCTLIINGIHAKQLTFVKLH